MRTLKAILFDIDDTLYSTSEFAAVARRNALQAMRKLGLQASLQDLVQELNEVVREFGSNYDRHYTTLLRRLPPSAYRGVNPVVLVAAAVAAYHDTKQTHLKPHPDAVSLLKVLSKRSVILGIVSDGREVKQAEKLLRLGIYRYFRPDAIFISEQMGISKPNSKIFRRVCSRIGVQPRHALYIGNSMAQDIAPASRVGLVTVFSRRGGREDDPSATPDHSIDNFDQLKQILREQYGLR